MWGQMGRNLTDGIKSTSIKMFGIESNFLVIGHRGGFENFGSQELGLGETFVIDLSNPEYVLAMPGKIGSKILFESSSALVGTIEDIDGIFVLDHTPKDGEIFEDYTFHDCRFSAGQIGGQVDVTNNATGKNYIYKVHQGQGDLKDKTVLIRAGQH